LRAAKAAARKSAGCSVAWEASASKADADAADASDVAVVLATSASPPRRDSSGWREAASRPMAATCFVMMQQRAGETIRR